MSDFIAISTNCAILYLCVDPAIEGFTEFYKQHIDAHNQNVLQHKFPNSGFDVLSPQREEIATPPHKTSMVNFHIKGEMRVFDPMLKEWKTTGYYTYPRSSLSKTPLVLANHVGIIDSGYRGWLMGAFRTLDANAPADPYVIEPNTRLLQICCPDLRPILVRLVDESFYESTERGSGGFGSTGR